MCRKTDDCSWMDRQLYCQDYELDFSPSVSWFLPPYTQSLAYANSTSTANSTRKIFDWCISQMISMCIALHTYLHWRCLRISLFGLLCPLTGVLRQFLPLFGILLMILKNQFIQKDLNPQHLVLSQTCELSFCSCKGMSIDDVQ